MRKVQRVRVLPRREEDMPLAEIARRGGGFLPTVCKCIDKALGTGAVVLRDRHSSQPGA